MLMGNLTRDPEVKYLPSGAAICQFGIAVNRNWKNDAGEKMEEVTFIDIEMFGKRAEVVSKYLSKGNPIYIEGRLKLDQWDDKTTGKKMSKLRVVGETFEFLGGKESEKSSSRPAGEHSSRPLPQRPAPSRDPDLDTETDSIPF